MTRIPPVLRARRIKTISVVSLFVGWWVCLLISVYWAHDPDRVVRSLLFFFLANALSGVAFFF